MKASAAEATENPQHQTEAEQVQASMALRLVEEANVSAQTAADLVEKIMIGKEADILREECLQAQEQTRFRDTHYELYNTISACVSGTSKGFGVSNLLNNI